MTNELEYVVADSVDKDDVDIEVASAVEDVVVSGDSNFPNLMTMSPRQHSEDEENN